MTEEKFKKDMATIQEFLRQMNGPYTTSEKIQMYIGNSIRFLFHLSIEILIFASVFFVIIATPFVLYKLFLVLKELIWS